MLWIWESMLYLSRRCQSPSYASYWVEQLSFLRQKDPIWSGWVMATVHFRPMRIQLISTARWHHISPSFCVNWVEQLSFLRRKDPTKNSRVIATVHFWPMRIQLLSAARWHHMQSSYCTHQVEQLSFLRRKDPIWIGWAMKSWKYWSDNLHMWHAVSNWRSPTIFHPFIAFRVGDCTKWLVDCTKWLGTVQNDQASHWLKVYNGHSSTFSSRIFLP